jgi:hypothetical protein
MNQFALPLAAASALALAACSAPAETDADIAATESAAAMTDDSAMADASGAPPAATGTPAPPADGRTLALEGLGDLVIGRPVPDGSSFAERGAQISETCRTVSSPDYPGVYAMTDGSQLRRITVGERSDVKLVEGIGVGATEAEVLAAFPGFRPSPHKYADAPSKYLTQPGSDPRLRFEIGENRRVSLIHVGLMPQLGYVEGCA